MKNTSSVLKNDESMDTSQDTKEKGEGDSSYEDGDGWDAAVKRPFSLGKAQGVFCASTCFCLHSVAFYSPF